MNQSRLQKSFAGFMAIISGVLAILAIVFGYKSIEKRPDNSNFEKSITEISDQKAEAKDSQIVVGETDTQTDNVIIEIPLVTDNTTNIQQNNEDQNEKVVTEKPITVAFKIIDSTPSNGTGNVAVNSVIQLTFNNDLDQSSVDTNTFRLINENQQVNGSTSYQDKVLTFKPEENLSYGTIYSIVITNVKDTSGNILTDYSSSFKTAEPSLPAGTLVSNFENGLDGWLEDATLVSPGFRSDYALQVHNNEGYSTATKKIFDAPILKNYQNLEFDLNTNGNTLMDGDASAIAFEQEGEWKWLSLSQYFNIDEVNNWQHIILPLNDFLGLDQNDSINYLLFRFWDNTANDYKIDNIILTGANTIALDTPTDLNGEIISDSQIDLSWTGNAEKYNIYKNGVLVGSTIYQNYSATELSSDTNYEFYVTATDGLVESEHSSSIKLKTLGPVQHESLLISNFESNTIEGWQTENPDNISLVEGLNSLYSLRLVNPINGSVGIEKTIDSAIAKNKTTLEFDINTNGAYFYDETAQVVFDQDGWRKVFFADKLQNGMTDWQHISIPLSEFYGLDTEKPIAKFIFRFWNFESVNIDLDNIILN